MTSLDTFKELGAEFGTSLTDASLKKANVFWCNIKDAELLAIAKQTFYASATDARTAKVQAVEAEKKRLKKEKEKALAEATSHSN